MEFIGINKTNYAHVQTIYKEGINTALATFETEVPDWDKWQAAHLTFGRLLAREKNAYLGWAALSATSIRPVYRGVAEVSVYVAKDHRGQGIGKRLLEQLITISENNEIWTLQAGIMRANKSSLNLHLGCGFRIVGYREKIGQLNNKWLDNIILERRSKTIGV